MKNFEALYYPSFEPPPNWLFNHLLFFDKIRTIIPSEADYKPSPKISEILEHIPKAYESISPEIEDKQFNDNTFNYLDRAFDIIRNNDNKKSRQSIKLIIDKKTGNFEFEGHTFTHRSKIASRIRNLLVKHNLIVTDFEDISSKLINDNYKIINKKASHLILANIADNISKKNGWNTITDQQLEYDFTIANNLCEIFDNKSENILTNAIINTEIPSNLSNIDIKDYNKIREDYSDIRYTFQKTIREINNISKLNEIRDPKILSEKINSLAIKFHNDIFKFKKSQKYISIGKYIPIAFGTTITFAVPLISGIEFGELLGPIAAIITEKKIKKSKFFNPTFSHPDLLRMITGMRKDIENKSKINKFLLQ